MRLSSVRTRPLGAVAVQVRIYAALSTHRMYTSLKCLIWGEDLASDPVGFVLSVGLKWVSHGSLVLDVQVDPRGRSSSIAPGWP